LRPLHVEHDREHVDRAHPKHLKKKSVRGEGICSIVFK
jgi:hypothetical protein